MAARVGLPLMEHQRHMADVAFEQHPDGRLVYGRVLVDLSRQEGKTALKFVVAVHRLTVMVQRHGPQRVTYTMQSRAKARTRLERDYAVRLRRSKAFREIDPHGRAKPKRANEWKLHMNSGVEHIQVGDSSYLQIDTPSREGGHGDTLDLGEIDEAFAHEDDGVEVAMEPALLTTPDSQLWVMSAPGDARSKYWYRQILTGQSLVADGCDEGTAFFSWAADPDDDPGDPRVWDRVCPALGATITEAKLAGLWEKARRAGPAAIAAFCRSYLGMWPEVPVLDDSPKFVLLSELAWGDCADADHLASGPTAYALDVDVNAAGELWCSVAASDGYHGELVTIDKPPGTGWVVPHCVKHKDVIGELLIDPAGPAGQLVAPLERAGILLRKVKAQEIAQADMALKEAVDARGFVHRDQDRLNRAAAEVVERRSGDGSWRFSRTLSPVDISPLKAVSLARWGVDVTAVPVAAGYYGLDDEEG